MVRKDQAHRPPACAASPTRMQTPSVGYPSQRGVGTLLPGDVTSVTDVLHSQSRRVTREACCRSRGRASRVVDGDPVCVCASAGCSTQQRQSRYVPRKPGSGATTVVASLRADPHKPESRSLVLRGLRTALLEKAPRDAICCCLRQCHITHYQSHPRLPFYVLTSRMARARRFSPPTIAARSTQSFQKPAWPAANPLGQRGYPEGPLRWAR